MTLDPPGFYGKVPARGDFIGRRVPPSLAPAWDDWLAALTSAVRTEAGPDWPEVWLTAPLWQFALGGSIAAPGQAGAPIAGVLVASADRVGRLFPFTILGPAGGLPDETWFDAIERLVLDALEDGFDPDRLDAALLALGAPEGGDPIPGGHSVWRCRGSDRVAAGERRHAGLPGPADCAAMVLGDLPLDPY